MTGMEERVRLLEISAARQEVMVATLMKVVEDNTSAIDKLTEVLNKSKGAGWALSGVAILIGSLVGFIVALVKGN